jgi:hypothetical protein
MTPSSFEERFDKKFCEVREKVGDPEGKMRDKVFCIKDVESGLEIKAFIKSELDKQRVEIEGRCEKAEKLCDELVVMFGQTESDLGIVEEVRELVKKRMIEGKSYTATWGELGVDLLRSKTE